MIFNFNNHSYQPPIPLLFNFGVGGVVVIEPADPPPNTIAPLLFSYKQTQRVDSDFDIEYLQPAEQENPLFQTNWQEVKPTIVYLATDFLHIEQTNSATVKMQWSHKADDATDLTTIYREAEALVNGLVSLFKHSKVLAAKLQTSYQLPPKFETAFKFGYQDLKAQSIHYNARFNHVEQVTDTTTIVWGPVPYFHICHHQYIQPRRVVFNFWDKSLPSTTFNFDGQQNPKVCVTGGSYFVPTTSAPTIDKPIITTVYRRRVHTVIHSLKCYRDSDNTQVHITSFNMNTSRDQWGFSFAMQCASKGEANKLAHVNGEPVDVRIELNGHIIRGIAENISRTKAFGSNKYSVSGRSIAARLAEPFEIPTAYSNSSAMNATQIIDDVLTGTGWTYTFDLTDWLIPAGALNLQSASTIDVIATIAKAAGGIVIADTDFKDIQLLPRNKAPYWTLGQATEDHQINDSVILNISDDPANTPLYNAVFVRGEQQGVSTKIKRSGTQGDKLAADVVDPLITHIDAARQRGTSELAEAGKGANIKLTTTIMNGLPLINPGALIAVDESAEQYKLVCDSTSVSAQVNQRGLLTVRQSITGYRSYEQ
ncbi:hypothetical protein [Catenovulum sediminis]|uniref:hypothetical protein n=1 Tax=Catenovulum sediminis TaxID=1740262 RepID=UPI00117C2DFE|nr:hypothetical protein [Catenovulum sediminis]